MPSKKEDKTVLGMPQASMTSFTFNLLTHLLLSLGVKLALLCTKPVLYFFFNLIAYSLK